ncbi:uncharacterized protein PFL1_05515 [Pseudozyma flocculosa PF-1]|uniref:Flavodoxin-like domain-containing protein n=2 Tax=Pseudozyma flocculosa TaxID=84751 RepID=A0A061H4J0_9BASI|nr:uncharacterized protein PFL1_05515 [Pseudozyma flocculosa PF-1]EPQ26880.1 hypothetical protein PFL1_05515 [Pseudozyma flocculosa PF-1]SPO41214.1 probable 1,4-Benzoquinone reductase [Pseudozyma flocculosa]
MVAKIAVVVWSLYGHVAKLTESVVEGLKSTGAQVDVYQFSETLTDEILTKMHGQKQIISHYPVITPAKLVEYDGIMFGFPTRYGRAPSQVSAFFDATGSLWAKGELIGKFGATFTCTASQHGGNETTHLTTLPFFVHHGINYVPLGYRAFALQSGLDEVHGASAYGAGSIAAGDGSRQVSANELAIAKTQGESFAQVVNTYVKGKSA